MAVAAGVEVCDTVGLGEAVGAGVVVEAGGDVGELAGVGVMVGGLEVGEIAGVGVQVGIGLEVGEAIGVGVLVGVALGGGLYWAAAVPALTIRTRMARKVGSTAGMTISKTDTEPTGKPRTFTDLHLAVLLCPSPRHLSGASRDLLQIMCQPAGNAYVFPSGLSSRVTRMSIATSKPLHLSSSLRYPISEDSLRAELLGSRGGPV